MSLKWILFSFDWDWLRAEQQLKDAIALNPQSPDAHRASAHLLSSCPSHGLVPRCAALEGRQ